MQLVYKVKKYVGKDKKEHTATNFYLMTEDNKYVAIKPAFDNSFYVLKYLATEVKDDTQNKQ
jgi:hypothetical protein